MRPRVIVNNRPGIFYEIVSTKMMDTDDPVREIAIANGFHTVLYTVKSGNEIHDVHTVLKRKSNGSYVLMDRALGA